MLAGRLVLWSLLGRAVAELSSDDDALPGALDVDDACARDGTGDGDGACSINAMQLRAVKAADGPFLEGLSKHPILELELFRPMSHKGLHDNFTNVDMYSIEGVLHYLHTRVVGEHVDNFDGYQEPRLDRRAVDIDIIAGVDARVRNPNSVISEVGSVNNYVEFAANAAFVDGMATGPRYNWDYGDIVGIQGLHDRAYPTFNPHYQFSLSGYCPNLNFKQKDSRQDKKTGYCMKYSDHYDLPRGETLRGGLCPNGTQPGVLPTGGPGCAYTYTPPTKENVTLLDDLVGITQESCGGRLCKDWQDFRLHCSSHQYKMMFNYKEPRHSYSSGRRRHSHSLLEVGTSPTLLKTSLCVEYDIHKACAKDCHSHECQRVPANQREIGLAFWKGRCDPIKNTRRAELLAQALGIDSASSTHSLVRSPNHNTCLVHDSDAMCFPDPKTGGMYCSRSWAGVCQPCYIPGAEDPYPLNKTTPMCPWDILQTGSDYVDPARHPKCASDLPQDYCCLYTNTCRADLIEDAMNISLAATEDGFAYVSSLQSTELMKAYVGRAAYEDFGVSLHDTDAFTTTAYWQWGRGPIPGASLEKIVALARAHAVSEGQEVLSVDQEGKGPI